MAIKIALAGNPNCGKTTMFNDLTGSNQYVGNWPGVTVEKKEGRLKGEKDVVIQDLPGIYSLSPYTLEEVVARSYLVNEKPDTILNIVDATNVERNLYLTTQLAELGIPMVVALNMIDITRKNGDRIDLKKLGQALGCEIVETSALKGSGSLEAAQKALALARQKKTFNPPHVFDGSVEHALAHIEDLITHQDGEHAVHHHHADGSVHQGGIVAENLSRWCAIKLFERDEKVMAELNLPKGILDAVEAAIKGCEEEMDDDSESIITNQRYAYISRIVATCVKKGKAKGSLTTSDKIDRVVTNRWLGLPIFAIVMIIVYYVSVSTVGTIFTDWANDGVFGDGWHLFGIGSSAYEEKAEAYGGAAEVVNAFIEHAAEVGIDTAAVEEALDAESDAFDGDAALAALSAFAAQFPEDEEVVYTVVDEETMADEEAVATGADLAQAVEVYASYGCEEPDPAADGVWVPGIPVLVEAGLDAIHCAEWLKGLVLDGIVAGIGAVLGFVPQMFVLFLFLAFLEGCGYMARIAFVLDRIFRRFGLSGKSFIPIMIGTGCGVPGIMASRTIENVNDRRMTIMTTTFIPCGAKLPFIAMIAGAIFGGAWWVSPVAYFMGMAAIICSGVILKKTKRFAGEASPFVMELPAYHWPTIGSILRSMWERGWSFIKKAGTIILLSTIVVWFTTYFGFVDGGFHMLSEEQIDSSILASIGRALAWIFIPQGWGNWQATVASITGLVAKENIVGTLGILYGGGEASVYATMGAAFNGVSGLSFLVFNLLCAPCFAAMGAIKREMNNGKWFWFAIGYQCGFAYCVALVVNQLGSLFAYGTLGIGTVVAVALVALFIYMLVRRNKYLAKS